VNHRAVQHGAGVYTAALEEHMFKVITENRKRPFWSSRTIAASVAFHLLLLAGFVRADEPVQPPPPPPPPLPDTARIPLEAAKPVREETTPPTQQPPVAQPAKGSNDGIEFPDEVPADVPEVDRAAPATQAIVAGDPRGSATGIRLPAPALSTGDTEPTDSFGHWVPAYTPIEVDVQPELADRRQAEMALRRAYPPHLRDTGVTGQTTVTLIIDREGNVEPGSVRVQSSTHDGFNEAAVRAVERFRFKPAMLRRRPVAVLVTLPIAWEIEK
jgi:TonB family protein